MKYRGKQSKFILAVLYLLQIYESYIGNAFGVANLLRGIHRAWKKMAVTFADVFACI